MKLFLGTMWVPGVGLALSPGPEAAWGDLWMVSRSAAGTAPCLLGPAPGSPGGEI